jgi:hypothetical protein
MIIPTILPSSARGLMRAALPHCAVWILWLQTVACWLCPTEEGGTPQ